jgi:hypothetical protein
MFLDLPDQHLDPLVISTDLAWDPAADPSIIKQKVKNLDFYCFFTSMTFFL